MHDRPVRSKEQVKALSGSLFGFALLLLMLAALAPAISSLSTALIPLVVVLAVAVIAVRLVFFHTRRW
jgi:hypothetical protein